MLKRIAVVAVLGVTLITGRAVAQEPPSLSEIRKVFIEPMPNDLHQYISAEITKQLKERILVVLQKDSADAILRGVSEQKSGVGAAITGRYLGLQDNANGSISLIDRNETVILWSAEAGDRSMWFGSMSRGGQRKVASRLVDSLKDALKKADRDRPRRAPSTASSAAPASSIAPTPAAAAAPSAPVPSPAPATSTRSEGSSAAPVPQPRPAAPAGNGNVGPAIEGSSPDQVIAQLGKPTYQLEGRDGVATWLYEIDGKTVRVFFFEGKASLTRQR